MDFKQALHNKKSLIVDFLTGFFNGKRHDWKAINGWSIDALDKLEAYTQRGKMLRGSLTLWTAEMLDVPVAKALPAAAAMELLQSALLVHDDIMDEDEKRRGLTTIHKQYERDGIAKHVVRADHFGLSMGLCHGDLAFFLAYEVLAESDDASLIQLFSELSAIVGLGQMQDVYWGMHDAIPSDQDILAMYEHKTATYTFCLPFLLAVRIAGKDELFDSFNELGKVLGKLFQIKDDELGLFGDSSLGKTVGLDILLRKKTLYFSLLLSLASSDERERLLSFDTISDDALAFVASLLKKYAVRSIVDKEVVVLLTAARSLIKELPVAESWQSFLQQLVEFNQSRSS